MEKLPKINIIYEDNHLLVVEKPVNMKEREAGESFANAWTSCLYMLKVSLAIIVDSIFRRNGGKK